MIVVTMVVVATWTIAQNKNPRHHQHQARQYKNPWFYPMRNVFGMGNLGRNQAHNSHYYRQHTAKNVWQNRGNNSKFYNFVFHIEPFD